MANVTAYEVRDTLLPTLGRELAEDEVLCGTLAQMLQSYNPTTQTLEELAQSLTEPIFDRLYEHLGETMRLRREDGTVVRIYLKDLPGLADDVMGALFDSMPVYSASFQILKDYSVRAGSLSAMRVLYQKFGQFQTEEEQEIMVRVIRERYPRIRYESWLKENNG